ncbi:MAG: protein kinase [Bradymonadaceae bacterium]|nr:protein kinase [Lujinxingiaceae bacterium]
MADDNEYASDRRDTSPSPGIGGKGEQITLPSDEPSKTAAAEVKVVKICKRCMVSQQGGGGFCVKCGAELVPIRSMRESCIGETVGGKYKIMELIGSGGMGEVYLGVNEPLGQRVAVKFLSRKFTADESVILRFLNEARSYCKVNHPHAVTLLEYGQHEDGALYLVTEFVEGKSLTDTVKDVGPMGLELVVSIASQCCEVLAEAHKEGVIHRDLKPDNIMLIPGSRGRYAVKVLDFGIAKIIDDDHHGPSPMTETGSIFGTPEFMSPEQARGEGADPRSDLYAMGVILFFIVTGKLPFRGKNKFAILNQHLNENPPRPSQMRDDIHVPLALEALILKCLNKRPEERYQSADDLAEALEDLKATKANDTKPAGLKASARAMTTETTGPLRDDAFEDGPGGPVSMNMTGRIDAVDAHAPTLGQEIDDEDWADASLHHSLDMSREFESGSASHFKPANSRRPTTQLPKLAFFGVVVVLLIAAFWYATGERAPVVDTGDEMGELRASNSADDLQKMLVAGQVMGLLEAIENMIGAGELEGAQKSLESTQALLDRGQHPPESQTRLDALSARRQAAENLQKQVRAAVSAGQCKEAERLISSLSDVSSGLKGHLAERVRTCRSPLDAARPALVAQPATRPTQPATNLQSAPAKVEPTKVDPVLKPVVEKASETPTKSSAIETAEPTKREQAAEAQPSKDAPKPVSEVEPTPNPVVPAKVDEELPDGMALPPKQLQ